MMAARLTLTMSGVLFWLAGELLGSSKALALTKLRFIYRKNSAKRKADFRMDSVQTKRPPTKAV